MKKYKVLVTSIGGDLGQAICKAIRLSNYPIKIIGTDCKMYEPYKLFCDQLKIIPRAESNDYIDFLNTYLIKENIDLMYICNETELFFICDNISLLKKEVKEKLVLNPIGVVNICKDKYKTVLFLKNNGLPYPNSILYDKNTNIDNILKVFEFPVVVKKIKGCGSKNVNIIYNRKDLNYILDLYKTCIIQEYLPGIEYTNGVYLDSITKEVHIVTFERKLREGMSFESKIVFDEEISDLCKKVAEKLNITGSINIQLRKVKNRPPIIFEINPRYSSTSFIRANFGFNDVIFAFENMVLKNALKTPKIKSGSAYRYITEYYKYDNKAH